jgi:hypothetical protein
LTTALQGFIVGIRFKQSFSSLILRISVAYGVLNTDFMFISMFTMYAASPAGTPRRTKEYVRRGLDTESKAFLRSHEDK